MYILKRFVTVLKVFVTAQFFHRQKITIVFIGTEYHRRIPLDLRQIWLEMYWRFGIHNLAVLFLCLLDNILSKILKNYACNIVKHLSKHHFEVSVSKIPAMFFNTSDVYVRTDECQLSASGAIIAHGIGFSSVSLHAVIGSGANRAGIGSVSMSGAENVEIGI